MATASTTENGLSSRSEESQEAQTNVNATTEYCAKLQEWMWQYYWGYANWQSWMTLTTFPFPPCNFPVAGNYQAPTGTPWHVGQPTLDARYGYNYPGIGYPFPFPAPPTTGFQTGQQMTAGTLPHDARPVQQQNGNAPQAGREYTIPSPLHRFLAETVDFFILFCVKATIILWIMHLSGMKDITKFVTHFIVEEIDENTSMEDLQKMMAVALVYRVLVCFYEIICIWGAGGATPGKFLLGLRVVTCNSSVLVRPNRVLVVPASNVTLSASTVRALNKNFSIAFLFPVFIILLFFQHNRTVYDVVAGTIVVQRRGAR
ncbi:protein FAM8A1-like [Salvelinus alpinus]|uniref:protein FAM8A1-like n=1 Tax=Salvelinus alpinus TaxID=8036 RepID=UPI0039FC42D1